MRNFFFLQTFIQDLKYAVRSLRKNPGFVSVVVASLALGIGANSTIFSVMNTLLYRPLPYRSVFITLKMVLFAPRSEEHTSELQSRFDLVCRLLLEKK